jgi:hypothetical protein
MPQISLYIDKDTLGRIEELAHMNNSSISKWVGTKLKSMIQDEYPEGFFSLFGAIDDDSFSRPSELSFGSDTTREEV